MIKKFNDFINEGKGPIEDKDWERMLDLVLKGDDGKKVADSIKDKKKAIARFIAGKKLNGETELKTYDWGSRTGIEYSGTFSEFGNKALKLGATLEEIQKLFDEALIPEKISQKQHGASGKKMDNRFVGDITRAIIKAGFDIEYVKTNGNALTWEGREAMERNGRKWTIGYKSFIIAGDKKYRFDFDAITDEGDGPTSYVIDHTDLDMYSRKQGIREFLKTLTEALAKLPK